jgi:hypothetical protein
MRDVSITLFHKCSAYLPGTVQEAMVNDYGPTTEVEEEEEEEETDTEVVEEETEE